MLLIIIFVVVFLKLYYTVFILTALLMDED